MADKRPYSDEDIQWARELIESGQVTSWRQLAIRCGMSVPGAIHRYRLTYGLSIPKGPAAPQHSKAITVRLTHDTYEWLIETANAEQVSASELLRQLLAEEAGVSK